MGKRKDKDKDKAAKQRHHEPIDDVPDPAANDVGNSQFARALGSGDFHTRDQGLQALVLWLTGQAAVADESLQKLWKGILYCFWHSDKEHVQRDLAARLAAVMAQVQPEVCGQQSVLLCAACADQACASLQAAHMLRSQTGVEQQPQCAVRLGTLAANRSSAPPALQCWASLQGLVNTQKAAFCLC